MVIINIHEFIDRIHLQLLCCTAIVLTSILAGCQNSKIPDINCKLNDIDLKKQSVQMNGLTMRLPIGIRCIKDPKEYPDFEVYRFIDTNSNGNVANLYIGNHPNIPDQNIRLVNSSANKVEFKWYIDPTNKNTLNLLVETGFTFPAFLHFWLDKKNEQTALEIVQTIRRNQ